MSLVVMERPAIAAVVPASAAVVVPVIVNIIVCDRQMFWIAI